MYFTFKIGGSLGLLTGMRLITGLELLFWFLAMITRICFKFEGKENQKNKVTSNVKESTPISSQRKLSKENKLKVRKGPFTTTERMPKYFDGAIRNRVDVIEDTMRKINLKLEIMENDLKKPNKF